MGSLLGQCSLLRHDPDGIEEQAADQKTSTSMGLLDVWYFKNWMFLGKDQLINNIEAVKYLLCKIIQGGHDMIATPNSAFRLHKAWTDSVLKIIIASPPSRVA
ncbi:hypothetical protein [Pseudomonas sp. R3-18-08]|uniref:hypothetical protein n=1 Tax=Pseudomonas sp. R3-18-08 TaxID=1173283 RepID=UPI000F718CAC|nr:hypothetical protein [Pseudomonas sp. R3-18-08]AZF15480.1 Proline iminopeptidase [Pseudomonas sp. R3-18-08]